MRCNMKKQCLNIPVVTHSKQRNPFTQTSLLDTFLNTLEYSVRKHKQYFGNTSSTERKPDTLRYGWKMVSQIVVSECYIWKNLGYNWSHPPGICFPVALPFIYPNCWCRFFCQTFEAIVQETVQLTKTPHNPHTWLKRAILLVYLGYPEVRRPMPNPSSFVQLAANNLF